MATERPLRRDAQRNRRRIIDAAREVFAAEGVAAGLNDVAHHAGVGIGTVYRHFPDKDVLVHAALREEMENLVAVIDEGLTADSAWDGLTHVFRRAVAMSVACRGLRDVAFSLGYGPQHDDVYRHVLAPRIEELLARARAQGVVRPDITVADLIMLMLMLTEFAQRSSPVQPDAYRRYVELVITALHPSSHGNEELSVTLSQADAQQISARWA